MLYSYEIILKISNFSDNWSSADLRERRAVREERDTSKHMIRREIDGTQLRFDQLDRSADRYNSAEREERPERKHEKRRKNQVMKNRETRINRNQSEVGRRLENERRIVRGDAKSRLEIRDARFESEKKLERELRQAYHQQSRENHFDDNERRSSRIEAHMNKNRLEAKRHDTRLDSAEKNVMRYPENKPRIRELRYEIEDDRRNEAYREQRMQLNFRRNDERRRIRFDNNGLDEQRRNENGQRNIHRDAHTQVERHDVDNERSERMERDSYRRYSKQHEIRMDGERRSDWRAHEVRGKKRMERILFRRDVELRDISVTVPDDSLLPIEKPTSISPTLIWQLIQFAICSAIVAHILKKEDSMKPKK